MERYDFTTDRDWLHACEEAAQDDPNWTWERWSQRNPVLPPERDAIARTQQAVKLIDEMRWPNIAKATERMLQTSPHEECLPLPNYLTLEEAIQHWLAGGKLSPRDRHLIRVLAEQAEPIVAKMEGLESLPIGRHPEIERPGVLTIPNNIQLAMVSHYHPLRVTGIKCCFEGNGSRAIQMARSMLAGSRSICQPSCNLTHLMHFVGILRVVRYTEGVLSHTEADDEILQSLQSDLENELSVESLSACFSGERGLLEDLVKSIQEGMVTKNN